MGALTFRQPRLVALALMVILAAGLSSLLAIGRQEDPTITNLFATVTTAYPGAEPARVESLVTAEIEDALREVAEVDTVESVSSTGISIVQVELLETLADDRIEQVWSELRDALSDVAATLPSGVQEPELNTDGAGAYAAIVALTADRPSVPMALTARWADALADDLRSVPGTKLVETFGTPEEEVLITLDAARAAGLGLTADAVSSAVRTADAKVRAGRVTGAGDDFVLEVTGEIDSLDRLRGIVLRDGADGRTLRLGDVAQVTRGPRLPLAEAALHDGKPAILVAAKLEDGLQVDLWAADIRAQVADFQATRPGGIGVTLVFDQSTYTADRLAEVGGNMALGIGLVVVVLLVTLGLRAALIVALILPVVSLATLATMNAIGLPIHQMSVTGLIVALGLLVDAGIVMTDEVGRRLRDGQARAEAVGQAVRRLTMPLFASTATTALSFVPMILLPGPAGDFVGSIALAVVIMLLWSFVVAVTITPAVAGWILPEGSTRGWLAQGIPAGPLGRLFHWSLRLSARNPIRSIALALVLPVLGFASMPLLTAQFFPGVDRDQFHIEVDLPPGTGIDRTQAVVDRLDDRLRGTDGIASVTWTLGRSAPAFYYNITGGRDQAPRYAQALIRTDGPAVTEAILPDLQRTLPTVAPEAQVLVRGLVQGPPVNAPVELRLVGDDLADLTEQGEILRRIASDAPAVTMARASITPGAAKLSVDLDEARARLVGLDPGAVALQLEAALVGVTGGSLLEGTEDLPVRVRLGDALRADPAAIRDMSILPPGAPARAATGAFPGIPLSSLAEVELIPGQGEITRRNAERVNTVQVFLIRGVLPEEGLAAIRERIDAAGFELPQGMRLEIGGDADARSSTLNNLLASLGLIVTLSIAVVVLTFSSFRLASVALVVAGLSAGLSMLALAVFGYPFGINAIIGLIGSIGVSINAALIIMTALQEDPKARLGDAAAMAQVVMNSARHIVSTTITTFGGFLPLILAGGGFWPPFAMAVAGGVLLSTVVSFYFTPPAYKLAYGRWQKAPTPKPQAQGTAQAPLQLVAAE
ncbi:acriflavin resistance protein [Jannaschia pagri]|uniref:Acriflavin resistance protein n=1 Tax=Jannaschia pagri TaxID=2829797 RepID=A0ABQ4NRI3_9RHOB|nr:MULTISPECIES: efflux RND transporter permease subunit [unclassified Jannaschia]GIT93019.1 acriflavin resistance protein [Jannaschia sp. AI_61]GIT96854.1 acriflavin resistance protein [Jannaschia sp. AI_62]